MDTPAKSWTANGRTGTLTSTMSNVPTNTEPLRRFAQEVMRSQGWTFDRLAANAKGVRGKSWLHMRLNEKHRGRLLRPDEIHALALALSVPEDRVRAADLAGFNLREDQESREPPAIGPVLRLPPGAARLTPKQQAALLAVVEAFLEPMTPEQQQHALVQQLELEVYETRQQDQPRLVPPP